MFVVFPCFHHRREPCDGMVGHSFTVVHPAHTPLSYFYLSYLPTWPLSSTVQIAISTSNSSDPRPGNFSAHITFAHKEDALACILATDG